MNNQLIYSSQKERRRKKADLRWNNSTKLHQKNQPIAFIEEESEQQPLLQSPMPIRLINLTPRNSQFPIQQDFSDIQYNLRNKLRQKNVCLPQIYQRQHKFKSLSPHSRSYEVSGKSLANSSIKQRLRTESFQQPSDSDQQDRVYQSTIIQICQMNDRSKKYNPYKGDRSHHKFKQVYRYDEKEQTHHEKVKFSHPSRQREFEQYVNHLQKSYKDKLFDQKEVKDQDIQQKLKNRVQTRKYKFSIQVNPEVPYGQKSEKAQQKIAKKSQQQSKQSLTIKSNKLTPSPRNKVDQISRFQQSVDINQDNQQAQDSETDKRAQKDPAKISRLRKQRAINDNFIKILRKVKNRGESLLLKLYKYPSRRLVPK